MLFSKWLDCGHSLKNMSNEGNICAVYNTTDISCYCVSGMRQCVSAVYTFFGAFIKMIPVVNSKNMCDAFAYCITHSIIIL